MAEPSVPTVFTTIMALNLTDFNRSLNSSLQEIQNIRVHMITWLTATTVVSVIGLFSFLLCYIAILCKRSNRDGIGWLILHQLTIEGAIVYILYPLSNYITYSVQHHTKHSFNCAFLYLSIFWFGATSYWTSLFIACNRYIALFAPHRFRSFSSKSVMISIVLLTHVIGLALNLPGYFGVGFKFGRYSNGECGSTTFHSDLIKNVRYAFIYYVPLIGAGVIYLLTIFRYALSIHTRVAVPQTDKMASTMARRYLLTKVFFVTYAWFFLCYILTPIISSVQPDFLTKNRMATLWLRFVLMCGYVASPIILLTFNAEYRSGIYHVARRLRGLTRKQEPTMSANKSDIGI